MAEPDENCDRRHQRPDASMKPADRILRELQVARHGCWRQLPAPVQHGQPAPCHQDHHHHADNLHDPQGIVARLVNTPRIAPPEVDGDDDGDTGRDRAARQLDGHRTASEHVVQETHDVLARGHAADRARQDVVEEQCRHRQLRERAAHRLLDDAVHAAADEHRGTLDVQRTHGVRKDHDAEDEPGGGLPDGLLDNAADVERRRPEVGKDNRRRAPERDEGQEDRRRDNYANTVGGFRTLSAIHGEADP